MKTNLKALALALVAGITFAACAEKPACESMMGEPAPAAKDKATAPAEGKQKQPRRRRTRKVPMSALPVTGMLDSAE